MVEERANLQPHETRAGGIAPGPIAALTLPLPGVVDVWTIPLKANSEELELLKKSLSPGELERAIKNEMKN